MSIFRFIFIWIQKRELIGNCQLFKYKNNICKWNAKLKFEKKIEIIWIEFALLNWYCLAVCIHRDSWQWTDQNLFSVFFINILIDFFYWIDFLIKNKNFKVWRMNSWYIWAVLVGIYTFEWFWEDFQTFEGFYSYLLYIWIVLVKIWTFEGFWEYFW